MGAKLTDREAAEAIEQFGDDMAKLVRGMDVLARRMSIRALDVLNAIPNQDQMDTIAEAFRAAGDRMSRECDGAEEAEDRRRANPLERDFRRLG